MADEADSLVLRYLRRIDARSEWVSDDVQDLTVRMTNVEEGLAGVNRRLDRLGTGLNASSVGFNSSMCRIEATRHA